MAAENECCDIAHGNFELFSQEVAEACGIKNTRHAAYFFVWQARKFAQCPNHRIKRVCNTDNECVWRVVTDAFANGLHYFKVDAQKVITAHAWLAWNAGSYDADVCACDIFVRLCA